MNPFYFGTSERRLFGVYEPARSTGGRARAAVLCNPWGPEYIHAHRSLRQLAARLSTAGHHTLRFDYFATGDSAGDAGEGDVAGWESDTVTALEELRDISGSTRVALIGLRLGAGIAARVAAGHASDVDALVLWDPVQNGADYLRSLRAAAPDEHADDTELQGFPLPPRLEAEIGALDTGSLSHLLPPRTLLITTDGSSAADAAARSGAAAPAMESLPAPAAWAESATITGAVPTRVIQRIVEWLG